MIINAQFLVKISQKKVIGRIKISQNCKRLQFREFLLNLCITLHFYTWTVLRKKYCRICAMAVLKPMNISLITTGKVYSGLQTGDFIQRPKQKKSYKNCL